MRLVDADAYADEMRKRQDECRAIYKSAKTEDERNYWEGIFMTFVEAKLTLDNIPTVDAMPVVRCKDCKHCEYPDAEKEWCKKGHIYRYGTWYCADGERKE